jgi:hypothetical protein
LSLLLLLPLLSSFTAGVLLLSLSSSPPLLGVPLLLSSCRAPLLLLPLGMSLLLLLGASLLLLAGLSSWGGLTGRGSSSGTGLLLLLP